jgi:two-component system KDP operon response regulator KdpE
VSKSALLNHPEHAFSMNSQRTLLVIEDEPAVLRFLRASIKKTEWRVLEATTARYGLELALSEKPHTILLDLGLPDQDGLDVLKTLRQWTSAPVIVISAKGQETDKITALDAGADDYLTKPFQINELFARLRVAVRHAERSPGDRPTTYEHEGFRVDLVSRRVWLRKKEIHLSPTQFDVLAVLVRNAGRVVGQRQLIKEVWGDSQEVTPESVRMTVYQIRHRIEADPVRPRHLKTEPGVGYRLEAD